MRAALQSGRGAQRVRAAAVAVILSVMIAGAFLVRRGAGRVTPVEARAAASDALPAAENAPTEPAGRGAAATEPAEPTPAEVLADARGRAAAEDWDRVVAMLSERGLAWAEPQTFAWDSLLAQAALRRAQQLPAGDVRRRRFLVTARDRATLALASVAPFARGTDMLRLLRAEACIVGGLDCETVMLTEDLLLAARSPHVAVSDRAGELLESVTP